MLGRLVISQVMVVAMALVMPGNSIDKGLASETSVAGLDSKSRPFIKQAATAAGRKVSSRIRRPISSARRAALTRQILQQRSSRPEGRKTRLRSQLSRIPKSFEREYLDRGTLPGSPGAWLIRSFPFPETPSSPAGIDSSRIEQGFSAPILLDRNLVPSLLMSYRALSSRGTYPVGPEGDFKNLQIEVSHSKYVLKLVVRSVLGKTKTLYSCRVGLGASSFPTPKGTYYVTHIYDRDPWWIPPENRAWAAGDSPSRRVYGGTMAPLLKKKDIRSRKKAKQTEDWIAGKVELADYGYRFHGTNAPRSIGRRRSHGCVRMLPKDARIVSEAIKRIVGTVDRRESENGSYVILKAPVKLNLVD